MIWSAEVKHGNEWTLLPLTAVSSLERVRDDTQTLTEMVLERSFYSNTLRVNVGVKGILASRQTWLSGKCEEIL